MHLISHFINEMFDWIKFEKYTNFKNTETLHILSKILVLCMFSAKCSSNNKKHLKRDNYQKFEDFWFNKWHKWVKDIVSVVKRR